MASKLSSDFASIQDSARKELELLTEALRSEKKNDAETSEKAVHVLQREFCDILTVDDMVFAFEVMENSMRAAMFLCMEGTHRHAWLMRQINSKRNTT